VLVATGIVAAAPAAAAGLVDWSATHHQQRRVGVVHATSNIVAVGLYAASLAARLRGRRMRGRVLAYLGFGAVSVGGVLGGHLAYRQAAGANHAEHVAHVVPGGWHDVGSINDLVDGKPTPLQVGIVPLVAVRDGAKVHVLYARCAHLSGPLPDGEIGVENGEACLTCPWHGSVFRLRDGEVVHGPATAPQPSFETRIDDSGRLLVRLPGADG
jgi:nitrite reductase/ring-hydroxylating ferredoxin subunit